MWLERGLDQGLPHSHAVSHLSYFALNKVSFFTALQIEDSCWQVNWCQGPSVDTSLGKTVFRSGQGAAMFVIAQNNHIPTKLGPGCINICKQGPDINQGNKGHQSFLLTHWRTMKEYPIRKERPDPLKKFFQMQIHSKKRKGGLLVKMVA